MRRLLCVLLAVVPFQAGALLAEETRSRGELTHDFAGEYELFLLRQGRAGPVRDVRDSARIEQVWSLFPYPVEPYPDVAPLPAGDTAFNEALYRRALSAYERALEELAGLREELQKTDALRNGTGDPLWWRWIDEAERWNRVERKLRDTYAARLARYFRECFATLDRIDRIELARSERTLELRKRSYRLYAVNQVALGNFAPALTILERLRELPGVQGEWPLYYYLSVCYAAQFRLARENRGVPETTLRELRRRKNIHKLRAVELKFGRESAEFRQTFDEIRLEELGSPRTSAVNVPIFRLDPAARLLARASASRSTRRQ